MQIRLTRKLADRLDGVDVSGTRVGEVIDLPPHEATLLIAEGWAVPHDPAAQGPLDGSQAPRTGSPKGLRRRHVRERYAADIELYEAADNPAREVRTVEQLREMREEMERRNLELQERRRDEDRIREELHDERSRTIP